MKERFLADTSAWHRSGATAAIAERWSELLANGLLLISSPVRLELLYSARSATDHASLADALSALPEAPIDDAVTRRAERTQSALARHGQHRGPTPIDLYVAATAEAAGATLVHYDRHFDTIARVTGQPMEWIAARGTLD